MHPDEHFDCIVQLLIAEMIYWKYDAFLRLRFDYLQQSFAE